MYDYTEFPNRLIFCVDLKSFFASVACIERGLDPLKVKLAVVGDVNRDGSVILAATQEFKRELGLGTGNRNFEIPKRKDIYVVNPTMNKYVTISNQITELLLTKYVAPADLLTYSIDEAFLDLTFYMKLHKKTPIELATAIQQDILASTGIFSTIGIAPNMLLAKICLDVTAKKIPSGIAQWTYDDVQDKMWKIEPLDKFWGIAAKTKLKLNRLGISSIGDLARYPKEVLIKQFGNVIGTELHLHSNGIDFSRVSDMRAFKPADKSLGKSKVLLRDYKANEIPTLILEQLEEVLYRLRSQKKECRTIHFGIGYSSGFGGFSKSVTIDSPSSLTKDWYKVCLRILKDNYDGEPVRTISIALKNIIKVDNEQISFFTDPIKKEKEINLTKTMDSIRRKYGKNSLLRACSFLEQSTIRQDNKKLGGHYA